MIVIKETIREKIAETKDGPVYETIYLDENDKQILLKDGESYNINGYVMTYSSKTSSFNK